MGTQKRINFITLEQAKSGDVLRGLTFAAGALAAVLLGLYDDTRWPTSYPGVDDPHATTGTPLRGHVLSGLMVEPDEAAFLTVTPGTLCAVVTPADGDDAALQLVEDPGVQDSGTLTFTANATASVRLDIVEVSIVQTTIESATVGVFNPSTKVFDPTPSSPKVIAPRLSYRIRTGVAGSGLPALVSGWLPIAVVNVQPAAAGFSTCVIWDVRPLVADRVLDNEPVLMPDDATTRAVRPRLRAVAGIQGSQAGAEQGMRGEIWTEFGGYKAGGEIRNSVVPPTFGGIDYDTNFLSVDTYLRAQGAYTAAPNQPYFFAVVFPAGLPRWVKYCDDPDTTAGKRVPRGPRGLLVTTTSQPSRSGYYSGLTPAAANGFTAAAPGVMLAAGLFSNTSGAVSWLARGNKFFTTGTVANCMLGGKAGLTTGVVTWTFNTGNSGYPINAVELIIDLHIIADGDTLATLTLEHNSAGVISFRQQLRCLGDLVIFRVTIPLANGEVDGTDARVDQIMKLTAGIGVTFTEADAVIAGFVFG